MTVVRDQVGVAPKKRAQPKKRRARPKKRQRLWDRLWSRRRPDNDPWQIINASLLDRMRQRNTQVANPQPSVQRDLQDRINSRVGGGGMDAGTGYGGGMGFGGGLNAMDFGGFSYGGGGGGGNRNRGHVTITDIK